MCGLMDALSFPSSAVFKSGYKSILLATKARLSTYISAPRNELFEILIVVRLITAVL